MKNYLFKTGKTTDGKDVLGGFFKAHDEGGFTLWVMLGLLASEGSLKNCVIDWIEFVSDAYRSGKSTETVSGIISQAVNDQGFSLSRYVHAEQLVNSVSMYLFKKYGVSLCDSHEKYILDVKAISP